MPGRISQVINNFHAGFAIAVIIAEIENLGKRGNDARWLAQKIATLRIFEDAAGKFNLSAIDVHASALVVSQFTLYADARRGRRPDFIDAARPEIAEPLIEQLVEFLREQGLRVATGKFQARMLVKIYNDGPVTIILDSPDKAG